MNKIHKVTSTKVTKSKNGYTIFNLELDGKIWASQLAPIRKLNKKYNKLYQIYLENETLDSLLGKFITISLEQTNFGVNFNNIASYNSFKDFKTLLDKSEKKAFVTDIPMYRFLKAQKYSMNSDGSISLKKPNDYFNIIEKHDTTVCYPNNIKSDELSFENIEKIYYKFYDKKYIDTGNVDRDCKYRLTTVAIVENCKKYHKYKSKTLSDNDFDILRIGDKLKEEHIQFLSSSDKNIRSKFISDSFEDNLTDK